MGEFEIREVQDADLGGMLALYTHLHDNTVPAPGGELDALWKRMLADEGYHLLAGILDGRIVSSCVVVVVPNLTHNQRPYALVENVVTHTDCRGRGYATQLLHAAREIAAANHCFKIMLLTGAKGESTLRFYERAGYNREDKTAFIQWLD